MILRAIQNRLVLSILLLNVISETWTQQPTITLNRGTIIGLKVFPETSKLPVYTFLGIPYALPPVGNLRFMKPQPHPGWNRTLFTRDFKPICPQIQQNMYDETNEGFRPSGEFYRMNEDCLFLNIWTPETALRYGNLPVVIIITGEEMAFDWKNHRSSGLDLASEGIIVITIQYRTNIFGWFGLQTEESPTNLALWDQRMAFQWINDNIVKFGGDNKKVTLLGHGTTGAPCAMIHLVSNQSKHFFHSMIFMSGTIFSPYSFRISKLPNNKVTGNINSQKIVENLACDNSEISQVLDCMQKKSIDDLLKAFENVYNNGNYTLILGPTIDTYLPHKNNQFIHDDPRKLIRLNKIEIPIMIGITNNEAAFIQNQWIDLAKQGFRTFKNYINMTVISNLIEMEKLNDIPGGDKQIRDTILWKFIDENPKTNLHLMLALQKILSEIKYEIPFFETIEILSSEFATQSMDNNLTIKRLNRRENLNDHKLFVYLFQQKNSIDMRGKENLFGGSAHSSDLPFLMGPSLFQQISRRRLTQNEEKFCRKMRQIFGDFIKTGNPTPGRLFDAWQPYTQKNKYIRYIGNNQSNNNRLENSQDLSEVYENINKIDELFQSAVGDSAIDYNLNVNLTKLNNYDLINFSDNQQQNEFNANKNFYYQTDINNSNNTSAYFIHLTKIYSFWKILLPKFYKNLYDINNYFLNITTASDIASEVNSDDRVANSRMINATGSKYKHAFYSMLILVCLLLVILCLCLYILKRNHKNLDTSFL